MYGSTLAFPADAGGCCARTAALRLLHRRRLRRRHAVLGAPLARLLDPRHRLNRNHAHHLTRREASVARLRGAVGRDARHGCVEVSNEICYLRHLTNDIPTRIIHMNRRVDASHQTTTQRDAAGTQLNLGKLVFLFNRGLGANLLSQGYTNMSILRCAVSPLHCTQTTKGIRTKRRDIQSTCCSSSETKRARNRKCLILQAIFSALENCAHTSKQSGQFPMYFILSHNH